MHVLFVHKNFPAQFGHIAARLVTDYGIRCTFATSRPEGGSGPIERVIYKREGGATKYTHFASRPIENFTWESHSVFKALRARPDIRPDVIVGHSGFGSTLFLQELYSCPIVSFCEWFYRDAGSDADFRPAGDQSKEHVGFTRSGRNAMLLADLNACTCGYSPFEWQRSQIPHDYQHKLATIFDGIEADWWRPLSKKEIGSRTVAGKKIPGGTKVVTYVSRGFELTRGFDIFIEVAKRICEKRSDVVFVCIGSDRVCYGADLARIEEKSMREHILNRGGIDSNRLIFTGAIPPSELVRAFAMSDLHVYLTAPFILSWSVMNALACGCTVLASDTQPLREVIVNGGNGLLEPFFDVDRMVKTVDRVLDDPKAYRDRLGRQGIETIHAQYTMDRVLPKMVDLYERAIRRETPRARSERPVPRELAGVAQSGLSGLRSAYPWPTEVKGPEMCDHDSSAWVDDLQREFSANPTTYHPQLILEIGAWCGDATEYLLDKFACATIIAVDAWHGVTADQLDHPEWKTQVAWPWDLFVCRLWNFKKRVVPVGARHDLAVKDVAKHGAIPDLILYDPDYNYRSVRNTLLSCARHFPTVPILGHDWLWPGMRAELERAFCHTGRSLVARKNVWRLEASTMRARTRPREAKNTKQSRSTEVRRCFPKQRSTASASVNGDLKQQGTAPPLRLLVTIPHFYRPNALRHYGSGRDAHGQRVATVQSSLRSLYETLASNCYVANLSHAENLPANSGTAIQLRIVYCVTDNNHLLADLDREQFPFEQQQVEGNPLYLGFACHRVLAEALGSFDYYVYLEDDLVLADSWAFEKLAWFDREFGEDCLLQPNRYELAQCDGRRKSYIDGDLPFEKTRRYQDVRDQPSVNGRFLGRELCFRRPLNPHSGCFFLTENQMRAWSNQPYFLDLDSSFYSPLEGAATVGVMRTFRIYKPERRYANFFEIRHAGDAWMRRLEARDREAARKAGLPKPAVTISPAASR